MENDVLKSLMEKRNSLKTKRERLVKQLSDVDKLIASTDDVVRLYGGSTEKRILNSLNVEQHELKGMTQRQALRYIAAKNGYVLKFSPAKALLVAAGVIKSGPNAASNLFSAIDRDEGFERIKRGVYKLVQQKESPHSVDALASTSQQPSLVKAAR